MPSLVDYNILDTTQLQIIKKGAGGANRFHSFLLLMKKSKSGAAKQLSYADYE
jgi:hypothetical protein